MFSCRLRSASVKSNLRVSFSVFQNSGGAGSMIPYMMQPFGDAEARIYSAGSVLAILIAVLAFRWLLSLPKTSHFPLLGQQTGTTAQKRQYFLKNAQKVFQEGYQKVFISPSKVNGLD